MFSVCVGVCDRIHTIGACSPRALRVAIATASGVVIATPEYNASVPGLLKNVIDWASRPYPDHALRGKPVIVVGASTSTFGAVLAQAELRRVLKAIGAELLDVELPRLVRALRVPGRAVRLRGSVSAVSGRRPRVPRAPDGAVAGVHALGGGGGGDLPGHRKRLPAGRCRPSAAGLRHRRLTLVPLVIAGFARSLEG